LFDTDDVQQNIGVEGIRYCWLTGYGKVQGDVEIIVLGQASKYRIHVQLYRDLPISIGASEGLAGEVWVEGDLGNW